MKKIIIITTVLVFLLTLVSPANMYAASNVTVDGGTVYQTIDGFGVSEAFHQSNNIALLGDTRKNEIYDLFFSTTKGAGFSIFRSILGDGGTWGNATDGPNRTMQPSESTWDWKESNDDQLAMYKEIHSKYGVNKLLYTVWSPPAWMKTNGSVVGGSLKTDKYSAYATYLAENIKNYKSKFGVEITHIGIQNEPDMSTSYSSCTWSGAQFKTFMKDYLVPTFDKEGITAKVVMGEDSNFSEKFSVDSLNDSIAVKRCDIVGAHIYGGSYTTFPTTKAKGKGIWMTEISDMMGNDITINDGMKWAKQVHDFMTVTQGNAWFYWWGACYKTYNGEGLIQLDMNSKTYKVGKRLYTIGQYARFVRPGWQRISATASPVSGVYVTAYKDPGTGRFAIVALNNGYSSQSVSYSLKGLMASSVKQYTTSSSQNLTEGSDINISGSGFTANLAANSITTYVGGNDVPATPTTAPTPTSKKSKLDVNDDGAINIADVMMIAERFNAAGTDSRYDAKYDLNSDGAINIGDVMMLAAKFNTLV